MTEDDIREFKEAVAHCFSDPFWDGSSLGNLARKWGDELRYGVAVQEPAIAEASDEEGSAPIFASLLYG